MTNKEFRELLNKRYAGLHEHRRVSSGKQAHNFGNRKRPYGDYLWFQDHDMFYEIKRRYEAGEAEYVDELNYDSSQCEP